MKNEKCIKYFVNLIRSLKKLLSNRYINIVKQVMVTMVYSYHNDNNKNND